MNEKFFEPKKPEQQKEKERELSPEEIEQLKRDMEEYQQGLESRIKEIQKALEGALDDETAERLQTELSYLIEQANGFKDFTDAIEDEDYEAITIKPAGEDSD